MTERIEVCSTSELAPGERIVIEAKSRSIGVFNVDGEYYALNNICPHQMAPLCEGQITGHVESDGVGDYSLVREGEIIQCPWHGWKFDIRDGRSIFNPHAMKTSTYDVVAEPSQGMSIKCERYGTELKGDEPPVETYSVEVEKEVVVVYL